MKKIYRVCYLILLSMIIIEAKAQDFVKQDSSLYPFYTHDSPTTRVADLNSDGDMDIVVISEDYKIENPFQLFESGIVYYKGGNNTFQREQIYLVVNNDTLEVLWTDAIEFQDMDGDNILDLFYGETATNTLYYFSGAVVEDSPQYTFQESWDLTEWTDDSALIDIALGDLNNDGFVDIMTSTAILFQDANFGEVSFSPASFDDVFPDVRNTLRFSTQRLILFGNRDFIHLIDLNNDGYVDVFPGRDESYYLSNGDGTFELIETEHSFEMGQFADINEDGFIDFVGFVFNEVGLFINNNGIFTKSDQSFDVSEGGQFTHDIRIADLQGIGYADIITSGDYYNAEHLYYFEKNGIETYGDGRGLDDAETVTAILDVNNDDKLDIVTLGYSHTEVNLNPIDKYEYNVFLNNHNSSNQAPLAPDSITFSANRNKRNSVSILIHTNQNGEPQDNFGVDYYLIDNLTGKYLKTANANQNGNRLVQTHGTIVSNQTLLLENLEPNREYTIGVQLIDWGLKGSPFTELTFSLDNQNFYPLADSSLFAAHDVEFSWAKLNEQVHLLVSGNIEGEIDNKFLSLENDHLFEENNSLNLLSREHSQSIWLDLNYDNQPDLIQYGKSSNGQYSLNAYLQEQGALNRIEYAGLFADLDSTVHFSIQDVDYNGKQELLYLGEEDGLLFFSIETTNDGLLLEQLEDHPFQDIASDVRGLLVTDLNGDSYGEYITLQVVNGQLNWVVYGFNENGRVEMHRSNAFMNEYDTQFGIQLIEMNETLTPEVIVRGTNGFLEPQMEILEFTTSDVNPFQVEKATFFSYSNAEPFSFEINDFEIDGYADLILMQEFGNKAEFHFYQNVKNVDNERRLIELQEGFGLIEALKSASLFSYDFNSDSRPDFIVSGLDSTDNAETRVYINNFENANTAPNQPLNVQATVNEDEVTISWDHAMDEQSEQNSLRYQVYLSESNDENNYRFLNSDWNSGSLNSKPVELISGNSISYSLRDGVLYTFAIQAIDAGGLASGPIQYSEIRVPFKPFKENESFTVDFRSGEKRFVDLDQNGYLDILYFGNVWPGETKNGALLANRNNDGSIEYSPIDLPSLPDLYNGHFDIADFNGDGLPDIVASGYTDTNLRFSAVYRMIRVGVGIAFEKIDELEGVTIGDVKFFDYDQDGDQDILQIGSANFEFSMKLYENTGNPEDYFVQDVNQVFETGYEFSALGILDIDKDGDLDFISSGSTFSRGLSTDVYINDNGRFLLDEDLSEQLPEMYQGDIEVGDFNNDGWTDFVLTGREGSFACYNELGNEDAEEPWYVEELPLAGTTWSELSVGDINNDGWLDIVAVGNSEDENEESEFWMLINTQDENFDITRDEWIRNIDLKGNSSIELADADRDGSLDILIGSNDRENLNRLFLNQLPFAYPQEVPFNAGPQSPSEVGFAYQNGEVVFDWSPSEDDHTNARQMRYNIRVETADDGDQIVVGNTSLRSGTPYHKYEGNVLSGTNFSIPELADSIEYRWYVQAIDQSGLASSWVEGPSLNNPELAAAVYQSMQENGDLDKRINVVFLAEGFQEDEQDAFFREAQDMSDSLFMISPYADYQSYFNTHAIFVPSVDAEITYGQNGATVARDTYFNTYRNNYNNEFYITIPNADTHTEENMRNGNRNSRLPYSEGFGKVEQLLAEHLPEYDLVVMLCKTNTLAGSAVLWKDRTIAFVGIPNSPFGQASDRFKILRHEIAHSLGLGDEYDATYEVTDHFQAEFPNATHIENLTINSNKDEIREQVRWNKWIPEGDEANRFIFSPDNLEETPNAEFVGFFEGAQYSDSDWYRAHKNDIMRNYNVNKFGPVNREWLIKAIYGYRWSIPGLEVDEIHRPRPIKLIQDHTPNDIVIELDQATDQVFSLEAEIMRPNHGQIGYGWRLDGEPIGNVQSSIDIDHTQLSVGEHTITFRIQDSTPPAVEPVADAYRGVGDKRWVIPANDTLGYLRDEITWTINVVNSVSNESEQLADGFKLTQNYPNPFNPSTQISYSLDRAQQVQLNVFNVLGQKVATLVNTNQSAGKHQVNFDATGLASGIYIYQLVGETSTVSKKMMLIK